MTGVGQPREGPSINLPQEAGLDSNANFRDPKDKSEHLEVPIVDSPSGEVKAGNVNEEPPGPPDLHPKTTPEPMIVDLPTDLLVPSPDSEVARISNSQEALKQTQTISGTTEVRLCWIERMA